MNKRGPQDYNYRFDYTVIKLGTKLDRLDKYFGQTSMVNDVDDTDNQKKRLFHLSMVKWQFEFRLTLSVARTVHNNIIVTQRQWGDKEQLQG